MAYPTISAPYGYKPINVLGGQAYAGSTRNLPIQYNYGTAIYYGDFVNLTSGYIQPITYPLNTTNTTVGIFLGCYYTNPTTKQRQFAQYYPGGVAAGDITAIVADDPDLVLQVAVTTGAATSVIGSATVQMVGANLVGTTTLGSASTGNGTGGVVSSLINWTTQTSGFRVINLVPDTQITSSGTSSAGAAVSATSITIAGLTVGQVIPTGTDLFNIVNGQQQYTGATVNGSVTVSSATSQAFTTTGLVTAVPAGGTVALVQTPEVLAKINFGVHRYNIS